MTFLSTQLFQKKWPQPTSLDPAGQSYPIAKQPLPENTGTMLDSSLFMPGDRENEVVLLLNKIKKKNR